jgi:hypothetical protein
MLGSFLHRPAMRPFGCRSFPPVAWYQDWGNAGTFSLQWKSDLQQYEFAVTLVDPFDLVPSADYQLEVFYPSGKNRIHKFVKSNKRGDYVFHGRFSKTYGRKNRQTMQPGTKLRLNVNVDLYAYDPFLGQYVGAAKLATMLRALFEL